ncbi:fungal hydrophobin [Schizophyllum commune Tattone D]|nr:fungal hydrophobin [Schizophyllum commune Tattone D]
MRFTIALFAALPLLAAASAVSRAQGDQECRGGSVQCCNTTYSHKDHSDREVLQSIGVAADLLDPAGNSYANCSPYSVVGGQGCPASSTAVCCGNDSQHGAINMNCVPITANA